MWSDSSHSNTIMSELTHQKGAEGREGLPGRGGMQLIHPVATVSGVVTLLPLPRASSPTAT